MKRWTVGLAILLFVGITSTASAVVTTTGTCYKYGSFNLGNSAYRGGYDVDSYGDTIYVNRDGEYLDYYTVTLADSDGDDAYEPDQHPDNPNAAGPMEVRTLTYEGNYYVPTLDYSATGEIYAASDRIYYLGEDEGDIYQYVFATDVTSKVVDSADPKNLSQLGYDPAANSGTGKWYASAEDSRTVYSWSGSAWVTEFTVPDLEGSQLDGLEVVIDPDTGTPYVYVSDMTSDYISQWRYDGSVWDNANVFGYTDTGALAVDGMGFGGLGHFWMTTGSHNSGTLYEIGGGDLGGYVSSASNPVPEPSTLALLTMGAIGLFGYAWRRRRRGA